MKYSTNQKRPGFEPIILSALVATAAVTSAPTVATAQDCIDPVWFEDFDSYAAGENIVTGQQCFPVCSEGFSWQSWDNIPENGDAIVVDNPASSAPNALRVWSPDRDPFTADDIVHTFRDIEVDSGVWQISAKVYTPGNAEGQSYFLLLNTYSAGGEKNWSTQLRLDADTGEVESEHDGVHVPLVTDQWVPIRVVIDFDADEQTIYYNDQLLLTKSWTEGFGTPGALRLEAIDLFGNNASEFYYDDFELCRGVCPIAELHVALTATTDCSWTFDVWQKWGVPDNIDEVRLTVQPPAAARVVNAGRCGGNPGPTAFTIGGKTISWKFNGGLPVTGCMADPPACIWFSLYSTSTLPPTVTFQAYKNDVALPFTFQRVTVTLDNSSCSYCEPTILVTDPSFEVNPLLPFAAVLDFFATNQGNWGAENGAIVGPVPAAGVSPSDGAKMLQMLTDGLVVTQAVQVIPVPAALIPMIDAGLLRAKFAADFNAHQGLSAAIAYPALRFYEFPDTYGTPISSFSNGFTLDADPATWELQAVAANIPPLTRWIVVEVGFDNASIGSLSGYVDDAWLCICPAERCVYDISGNGDVDFADILAILAAWGNAGGPEDLDGSGFVDFGDLLLILAGWGPCP